MSTDSSELTFVRCPSCRSLVPAASSRCKMCGASLDVSAQPDQSEEERKKSGRVRQHTTTQNSMAQGHASQVNAEQGAPAASALMDAVGNETTAEVDDLDDDPFDIFDMDDEDEPLADNSEQDESDLPADPLDTKPAQTTEVAENPLSSFLPEDEIADEAPAASVQPVRKPEPQENRGGQQFKPLANNGQQKTEDKDPVRPKVSIESGGRPAGKSSSLSFSKPKNDPAEAARDKQSNERTMQARHAPHEKKQAENGAVRTQQPAVENTQQKPQQQRSEQQRAENTRGESQKIAYVKDRLFGWFVNYEKPQGAAIELREGRFFITGSQLKPNDLVIADKGLSTPHVLASVSSNGGLRIQDLMSESGLFVRRKNAGSYTKEESGVQLEHGDWVKFGEVEFLVALITNSK